MSAVEHSFCGTWEIVECSYNEQPEIIGLEGIKFRLDEMGDITWYNDLIDCRYGAGGGADEEKNICNESAEALFSCETFEFINMHNDGPILLFGAFAGHSIEFRTDSTAPTTSMALSCDGWYTLLCRRVKEEQSSGLDVPFTLMLALQEGFFSDACVKSSEGHQFYIHSPILRLNGFDCSGAATKPPQQLPHHHQHHHSTSSPPLVTAMSTDSDNTAPPTPPSSASSSSAATHHATQKSQIKISIIAPPTISCDGGDEDEQCSTMQNPPPEPSTKSTKFSKSINATGHSSESSKITQYLLSPNLLLSPSLDMFQFPTKIASNLSSSFNCLSASIKSADETLLMRNSTLSTSDSNLKANTSASLGGGGGIAGSCKNIFNFSDFLLNPMELHRQSVRGRPPLSPYRARSPLLSHATSFETPPSSPLTPIAVLQTLPAFMLSPIFQWLYAECLPVNMDEETVEKLINFAESTIPLNKMVDPCRQYLRNMRLKKFVISVVMDVHACLNRIIFAINPASASRRPAALCQICKFAGREVAVGCAKVLQFCNIFVKDSSGMSRYQRHEIIKYVRSRLPIFLAQIHQLLQNILCILSNLCEEEKSELVVYLVPEIKASLKLITEVVIQIKSSLEEMCKDLKSSRFERNKTHSSSQKSRTRNRAYHHHPHHPHHHHHSHNQQQQLQQQQQQLHHSDHLVIGGDAGVNSSSDGSMFNMHRPSSFDIPLSKHMDHSTAAANLKFVLYIYEVKKMKDIYGRVSMALEILQEKRNAFDEMNTANKQQTIRQNLEQLILDIPTYILIIENISNSLDEKIGWKEFKFFFKLATSQINGVVSKLLDHRSALKDAMTHICELVQKNQFTQTVIELGLLEPSNLLHSTEDEDAAIFAGSHEYHTNKINLLKHMCEPPVAAQSILSKNALRLLHSGQFSDMEFEIIVTPNFPPPANQFSRTSSEFCDRHQVHTFRAHRVIVASRCEWFKKALSSGMQESINKRITIHDTSPVIFRRLLLYLYGAPVDKTVGAEHICELMLLADRFSIDALKDICETTLKSMIDNDSVLYLLGIADRYNAGSLKANCFAYISQHEDVVKSDIIYDLPKALQAEIQDLMHWCNRVPEPWADRPRISSRHSLKSRSRNSSKSRSRKSSPSSHM